MDYQTLLYGPIYLVQGVDATLTLPNSDGDQLPLTVLDKTSGINVDGPAGVQTILPAAAVRAAELTGVDLTDLEDATIAFNGKNWRVKSHRLLPSPKGESDGEIYLILSEN